MIGGMIVTAILGIAIGGMIVTAILGIAIARLFPAC